MKGGNLFFRKRSGPGPGVEPRLPQNLIRHPVPDAGKKILQKKKRFELGLGPSLEKGVQVRNGKPVGKHAGRQGRPPGGRLAVPGHPNPPKEPGILKNQGAVSGVQDEVVMLFGAITGRLGREPSGHPQMNPQPEIRPEPEQHLFSVGLQGTQGLALQGSCQRPGGKPAEDPLARVKMNPHHLLSQADPPLAAEIVDLGQFRHRHRVRNPGENPSLGEADLPIFYLDGGEIDRTPD